jgi:hypothetical protein
MTRKGVASLHVKIKLLYVNEWNSDPYDFGNKEEPESALLSK